MDSKSKVAVDLISTTLITVLLFISLAYLNYMFRFFESVYFVSYLIMLFIVTAIFMNSYRDKLTGYGIIAGLGIALSVFLLITQGILA